MASNDSHGNTMEGICCPLFRATPAWETGNERGLGRCTTNEFVDGEERERLSERSYTLRWAAPEVIAGNAVDTTADIYSFGMLLYELLTHNYPYSEISFSLEVEESIQSQHRPLLPVCTPHGLTSLVQLCWAHYPEHRPSIPYIFEVLTQEFLTLAAMTQQKEEVVNMNQSGTIQDELHDQQPSGDDEGRGTDTLL